MNNKDNLTSKKRIYLIKDTVSKLFGNMFSAVNDEMAQRQFQYGLAQYPFRQDTQLYYLGELDEETGDFIHDLQFISNYKEINSNEE